MSKASTRLSKNSTLSVISPASPTDRQTALSSLNKLKDLGFNYKIYDHLFDSYGYLAGDDDSRASDFNKALKDNTDGIICLRGGYGTLPILDKIDFTLFKNNPKAFIGFSDITTILNYLYKEFNIITFHAPMLTSNFDNPYTRESFIDTLTIKKDKYFIKNPKDNPLKSISFKDKKAIGNIIGGNLSLITSMISTKYEIPFDNNIIFIEEINEPPYKIDRMITHLYLTKKLHKCAGIILGDFTLCDEDGIKGVETAIKRLSPLKKPIIYNLKAGHGDTRITIPIGAKACIDTENNTIEILESVVS